jgi:SSS family solute:Na+ symporter
MGYVWIILGYFLVLTALNVYRLFKIKTQEDFMVAGRRLSIKIMVFTLICTWIGSGTFIAGAEYAWKAGWSSLWMPAGAWVGIVFIYFLAARIRTFGQFTVGDILEERYGRIARIFGAATIIIAFTTIVSYQFRAGGIILEVATDGRINAAAGQTITAGFVVLFTALAGMVAVVYTDLPNGIVILLASCIAAPIIVMAAGGWHAASRVLPPGHFEVFSKDYGYYPALKALGYFLSTLLLLMGIQSLYQKFYSARTPRAARLAVIFWIIGTVAVEIIVLAIAIYGSVHFWNRVPPVKPESVVLLAARHMMPRWAVWAGFLLLMAGCAVVISTGMNYLLSPSTNVMRDLWQRFIRPGASQKEMVYLQKGVVVFLGFCAWLMIFIPTMLGTEISVLKYTYFAYTMYGVSITPALVAALVWRRATKPAGVTAIFTGAAITLIWEVIIPNVLRYGYPGLHKTLIKGGDLFGVPGIFPAFAISMGCLVVITYLTRPPPEKSLEKLFPKR